MAIMIALLVSLLGSSIVVLNGGRHFGRCFVVIVSPTSSCLRLAVSSHKAAVLKPEASRCQRIVPAAISQLLL